MVRSTTMVFMISLQKSTTTVLSTFDLVPGITFLCYKWYRQIIFLRQPKHFTYHCLSENLYLIRGAILHRKLTPQGTV